MNKDTETIKKQEPISKAEYREGADGILYPIIAPDENQELDKIPEGIFAAEAVKYLVQNHPKRVQELKIQGTWFSTIYQIDNQALEMMDKIQQELKKVHPAPQTENFTELASYNNWIRETAQEIVMKEVVRVPR
ncbi:TnpV protein [Ruminiclostridium papyrosolvens]|uniref:TnpV protein n=1 Tax=Ruminiclostridium papyrosolvens TaxID=29362 RepID=UPI003D6DA3E6